MITEKTQKILCNLLLILSKGENSIQITRQIISRSLNYSANLIFSHLTNSYQITDDDLFTYLYSKNFSISKLEAQLIILFYDKNIDNILSYDEFIQLISNNKSLNNNFLESNNETINEDIEFLFDKILQKEIELCRKFLLELNKLKEEKDFEIHKVFHSITNLGYINQFDIERFLQQNQINYLDGDIINIMNRLDIKKDGVIDIEEFNLLFNFPNSKKIKSRLTICNRCREFRDNNTINSKKTVVNIITKQNNIYFQNDRYNKNNNIINEEDFEIKPISSEFSNHRIHYINESSNYKNITTSPFNKERKIFHSQKKKNNLNNDYLNKQDINKNIFSSINNLNNSDIINDLKSIIFFLRNKKYMEGNKKYYLSPKNHFNPKVKSYRVTEINSYINSNQNFFTKFNNLLKLIIRIESEIEKEKINFVKNLKVPFREIYLLFDKGDKGCITEEELKDGFYKIKIIDEEGCEIFMKRYDVFKKKKIEESDFFDAIVPFNKKYRKYVENVLENKFLDRNYNILEDINTMYCLKNVFSFIINKEKEINNYKINFIERNYNSIIIEELFNIIDNNKKGFFTYADLKIYLTNNKLIADDYASALLFIRLDKFKKGNIEFEDLMKEL